MNTRQTVRRTAMVGVLAAIAMIASGCWTINYATIQSIGVADAPDPTAVFSANAWHVYTTQDLANGRRLPHITLDANLNVLSVNDAMGANAPWMTGANIWAPAVAKVGANYLLFFSAGTTAAYGNHECIGVASSPNPAGPFNALPQPAVCSSNSAEQFLDPSIYASGSSLFLLYVRQFGPRTGDIRSIQVSGFGVPIDWGTGQPYNAMSTLLVQYSDAAAGIAQDPGDYPVIENPEMWGGELFVSAGTWNSNSYHTLRFLCGSPTACTNRSPTAALWTLNGGFGPGGMSVGGADPRDGRTRVFFHSLSASAPSGGNTWQPRGLKTAILEPSGL